MKLSIFEKVLFGILMLVALLGVADEVWYMTSNFRYEEELIQYICEDLPGPSVGSDDKDFVMGFRIGSKEEIDDIVSSYNEYIRAHSDVYVKRFNSFTLEFYMGDDTPVAVAVSDKDTLLIGDVDFSKFYT